jgi:hypothetical protein
MFELETLAERFFSVFATMVSLAMASVFVSLVTNQVAEIKRARHGRESKMEIIRKLSMRHCLSNALVMRMKAYITSTYMSRLKGQEEAEFHLILSQTMRADLQHEMWGPVLRRHAYFKMVHGNYQRTLVKICARAVHETVSFKDDVAFGIGDYGDRAFFMTRGAARYGPEEQEVVDCYMTIVISEAALWMRWQHRESLVCLETTCFATVVEKDLHDVVKEHINTLIDTVAYAREFVRKAAEKYDELTDLTQMEHMPSVVSELRSRLWASLNASRASAAFRASVGMEVPHASPLTRIVPEATGSFATDKHVREISGDQESSLS